MSTKTYSRAAYLPPRPRRRRGAAWKQPAAMTAGFCLLAGGGWLLWNRPPPPTTGAPPRAVAVLVGTDGTASDAAFGTVLAAAVHAHDQVLVGQLHGAGQYVIRNLTPEGGGDLERTRDGQQKAQALRASYAEATTGPSGGAVIEGLHALAQQLEALPHDGADVVLLGSVVDVGAGVSLTDPVLRADTTAAVATVASSGLLPTCTGQRFYIVGGGVGDGQPVDSLTDLQLQEFYRQLIAKCGGTLAVWNGSQLPAFPVRSTVPPATWGTVHCAVVTIPLGDDLLFDSGSDELRASARPYLERLRSSVSRDHPDGVITITGYTDNQGKAAYNRALSKKRAASLARWLRAHGVPAPRLRIDGQGPAHPVASNVTASGRQQNRRVEITVSQQAGGCTSNR